MGMQQRLVSQCERLVVRVQAQLHRGHCVSHTNRSAFYFSCICARRCIVQGAEKPDFLCAALAAYQSREIFPSRLRNAAISQSNNITHEAFVCVCIGLFVRLEINRAEHEEVIFVCVKSAQKIPKRARSRFDDR